MSTINDGNKDYGIRDDELIMSRTTSTGMTLRDFIPIYVPAMEKGALDHQPHRQERFLDFLKARPSKDWYRKFGFVSRLNASLRLVGSKRNGTSYLDSFVSGFGQRRFRVPFVRNINWPALKSYCKDWIKHPMNMGLLVWLLFVAVGIVLVFLLMTGLLNGAIPDSGTRDHWTEVANQVLNALFTIMCVYQHPRLFHHLVLLFRWSPADVAELRTMYCKDAGPRPHEWAHLMLVALLLQLTCLDQYAMCTLYWAFPSKTRPDWAVNMMLVLGIVFPVAAALYIVYSPLGKKYKSETDEESQREVSMVTRPEESQLNLNDSGQKKVVIVTSPEWVGGLFDCWDDMTVAYLSFFCTFCVFGWNLERLGFGNMYVHIVTFIILCVAPFWIFSVAALNINNDVVKFLTMATGILLCILGLFYGGFWRMQMRNKFKLPGNPFCCGSAAVTDFMQWLCCCWCALAQEVRTGNFYDVEDESFCRKDREREMMEEEECGRPALVPLPREGGSGPLSRSSFDYGPAQIHPNPDNLSETISLEVEQSRGEDDEQVMAAPVPPLIHQQDRL